MFTCEMTTQYRTMTKLTLEEELQKRRLPNTVLQKLTEQRIGSVVELATRPDLMEYFENDLKPIQLLKLKSMIRECEPGASEMQAIAKPGNDNDTVENCVTKENVLIAREQNATRVELIQQFQIECEQLKKVIDLILDDTDYVSEKAKAILERSKAAHQCRANRLKQILLDVHKCTPDTSSDASYSSRPIVETSMSTRKLTISQHKWRVRIDMHPKTIERRKSIASAPYKHSLGASLPTPPSDRSVDAAKSVSAPPAPRRWSLLSMFTDSFDFFSNSEVPAQAPAARQLSPASPPPPPGLQGYTAPAISAPVDDSQVLVDIQQETRSEKESQLPPSTLTIDMLDAFSEWRTSIKSEAHNPERAGDLSTAEQSSGNAGDDSANQSTELSASTDTRPSVQQRLRDLTTETDKFHVSMGPCECHASDAEESNETTAAPKPAGLDTLQLCSTSRSVHQDFYELLHQLTVLCWDVHHYNYHLDATMSTRRSLNAQYRQLPRGSFNFWFESERLWCKNNKAELDASQAALLETEAYLASTWDELHKRCNDWNHAAALHNNVYLTVKDECLRWGTGLSLVSDISPLPEVDLSDSVLRIHPGLFLVAAGATSTRFACTFTLVSPCWKLYIPDYTVEVWKCISRLR